MRQEAMRRLRLFGPACVESIPSTQANPAECAEYERSTGTVPRFRSRRTVALLGYLVAERRSVARDFLAALFWPDEAPSKGRGNLSRALHNLVEVLPSCWASGNAGGGLPSRFWPASSKDACGAAITPTSWAKLGACYR